MGLPFLCDVLGGLRHWLIDVTDGAEGTEAVVIELPEDQNTPPPLPRPVPTTLKFFAALPLLNAESQAGQLEARLLRSAFEHVVQLESNPDEANSFQSEVAVDMDLLRLFRVACTNDHAARALDLAQFLHFPKSYDIAVKRAYASNHVRLGEIVEDLRAPLLEEQEKAEKASAPVLTVDDLEKADDPEEIDDSEVEEDWSDSFAEPAEDPEPKPESPKKRTQSAAPKPQKRRKPASPKKSKKGGKRPQSHFREPLSKEGS